MGGLRDGPGPRFIYRFLYFITSMVAGQGQNIENKKNSALVKNTTLTRMDTHGGGKVKDIEVFFRSDEDGVNYVAMSVLKGYFKLDVLETK